MKSTPYSPFGRSLTQLGREPRHVSYGEAAATSVIGRLDPLQGDRHRQLFVAALVLGSLVGGGELLRQRAERLLVNAGVSGLGLRAGDAEKNVRRGLDKGMKSPRSAPPFAEIHNRTDAVMRWYTWLEGLDPADPAFGGRRGTSLLKLHVGVGLAGIAAGKVDLGLSVRKCAEWSGLSTSTVCTLVKNPTAIEGAGFLHLKRRKDVVPIVDGYTPMIWLPTQKGGFSRHSDVAPTATHPSVATNRSSDPAANVFHRRPTAWRVLQFLRFDEEATVRDLVKVTGFTAPTVRANLHYLTAVGLADRADRFCWRGTLADSKTSPAADGIDHAARRRERHQREHEEFAARRSALIAAWQERRAHKTAADDHNYFAPDESMPIFDPDTGEIVGEIDGTVSVWPDSTESARNRFGELERLASWSKGCS